MVIKAIDTLYKGYLFRSRLEARWAVFLDTIGAAWDYEKEGYDLGPEGWYLPDFFVHSNHPDPVWNNGVSGYWVEIKGTDPTQEELNKMVALTKMTHHTSHLFIGLPGERLRWSCSPGGSFGWSEWEDAHGWTRASYDLLLMFLQVGDLVEHRDASIIDSAINAAKQARFEHDQYRGRR